MKKSFLFLAAIFFLSTATFAQVKRDLKKVMELKMPPLESGGTRGAGVVWHPVQKKYYVSFAGNESYPMAVFSADGKRLTPDDQATKVDTRGLWYNPAKKQICGNGYNDNGWFSYTLDAKGLPKENKIDFTGMNQPDAQCVGAYNPLKKKVMFLFNGKISFYSDKAEVTDEELVINWGRIKTEGKNEAADEDETPAEYNTSTVIYTGIKGSEIGFLNVDDMQVELYDLSTGFLTTILNLPEGAPAEHMFNFAYANGMYWLFSMNDRVWTGYK
jgi:hypothetical protein